MYVRAVDVAMGDGVMPMHMGVRLADRIARGMNVVVVLIVDMAVLVLQDSVGVQVAVLLSQERRDAQGQHEHGDPFASSEVVAEDRDGRQRAGEWGDSKECCLPSSPEKAHRLHGEDEAQAVAGEAKQERGGNVGRRRKALAEGHRKREARGSRSERLCARDCQRISQRETLREVVVERPAQTGAGDRGDPENIRGATCLARRQDGDAQQDDCGSTRRAKAEVLAKDQDGEEDREGRLEVQGERADEPRDAREPGEHQEWPEDTPGRDDGHEQADVRSS
jgi:hypothetical protein